MLGRGIGYQGSQGDQNHKMIAKKKDGEKL